MVNTEVVLSVGQIIFAAMIAIIPPLYPNYSLYTRRALTGIKNMNELNDEDDGHKVGWVKSGENGFKQLNQAIDLNRPLDGEVRKFGMLWVETRQDLNNYLDSYYGSSVQPNQALFVEYTDGRREPVICHPFDPHQTRRLTELREWIRSTATVRSNYLTAALAVIWTAIAVSSTLLF